MSADLHPDDSLLDRPEVLACLFYPRSGFPQDSPANTRDLSSYKFSLSVNFPVIGT